MRAVSTNIFDNVHNIEEQREYVVYSKPKQTKLFLSFVNI